MVFGCRSQQATQTPPGLDASSQEEGINRSAEVVVSPPGEPVKDVSSGGDAQPAAEPMTAHEPGGMDEVLQNMLIGVYSSAP